MGVSWEEDNPVGWHYPGRKSVGYFGAVRVRDGKSLFRKEPEMSNGETFWAFLRQLETPAKKTGDALSSSLTTPNTITPNSTQPRGSNGRADLVWTSCHPTAPS